MINVCKCKKDLEQVIEKGLTTVSNYARQQTKKTPEMLFQIMHNYPVEFCVGEYEG